MVDVMDGRRAFLESLSSMRRGKASITLSRRVRSDGVLYESLADLIEKRFATGWRIANPGTSRWRFQAPDGAFLDTTSITKTGLDYAWSLEGDD